MPLPKSFVLIVAAAIAAVLTAGCARTPAAAPNDAGGAAVAGDPAAPGGGSAADPAAAGTPSEAFDDLRAAVEARDWGRFYDGIGPQLRAAEAAKPAPTGAAAPADDPRARFIADMTASMAIVGQPSLDAIGPESFLALWEGVAVVGETIDGDRAIVTVSKDGAEWKELFVREDGRWKFDGVPEGDGP